MHEPPVLRVLNMVSKRLPLWTWQHAPLLRPREWMARQLDMGAAAILLGLPVLVISFPYLPLNAQAVLLAGGVFALVAAILGFYAFGTSPGKVGAIGGLALVLAVACLLSFTTIAGVRQSGVQPLPVARAAVPGAEPSFTADQADDVLQPQ